MAGDHWLVTGSLADGGTLPKEIFIYENTGDGTLGTFSGTCNLQELGRLQIITLGTPQPVFGNKYLRHSQIKIDVALQDSPSSVVLALVANVKALSVAYANQVSTSTSYPIP
jgi:hypothetical protein